MATAKESSDDAQRALNVDVDALLEAIQVKTSGDVRDYMDFDPSHRGIKRDSRHFEAYTEIAEAFELDIHDCTSSEMNR